MLDVKIQFLLLHDLVSMQNSVQKMPLPPLFIDSRNMSEAKQASG